MEHLLFTVVRTGTRPAPNSISRTTQVLGTAALRLRVPASALGEGGNILFGGNSTAANGTFVVEGATVYPSNTSADPITGTFSNLPDGAIITINGNNLQANYSGGDGNDLTLTVVP
jgi:hypothetical protein